MLTLNELHQRKYLIITVLSSVLFIIVIITFNLITNRTSQTTDSGEQSPNLTEQNALQPEDSTIEPTAVLPSDYFDLPTPIPDNTVPGAPPTPIPQPGDIILDGIAVDNFRETAARVTEEGDVIIAESLNYQIVFYESLQEFSIYLTGDNFEQSQDQAEQIFLQRLRIDEANACRLFVNEIVSAEAKNDRSGEILPLSFCYHEYDE